MSDAKLPRKASEVAAAAEALGLRIPDACMAGVIANLALLDRHAERLRSESPPA